LEGLFGEKKASVVAKKKASVVAKKKEKEWQNSAKRKNRSRNLKGAMNQIPQQLPPKEKLKYFGNVNKKCL
jgi:ribosomal protein L9